MAPKRRSLVDVAAARRAADASERPAAPASKRDQYPSMTVYLPRPAIRLIKQIALEEDRRLSDIIAEAVDDWLRRHGHKSLSELK